MKKRLRAAAAFAVLTILSSAVTAVGASALSADSVSAPSAVLMDSETGQVLFDKDSHSKRPCASITKVMTLLLVFEAIDDGKISMKDEVSASEHAASMGGSDIWLEAGEVMSVDDLIKATTVASANDDVTTRSIIQASILTNYRIIIRNLAIFGSFVPFILLWIN